MDCNTYKYTGVSMKNGQLTVRYTNDPKRTRVLEKHGHTRVLFIELEEASRVEDCVDTLLSAEEFAEEDVRACIIKEAERLGFVFE